LRLQGFLFGAPSAPNHRVKASSLPIFIHLALVLLAGIYLPTPLQHWFQKAAELLR
jgi:hydrogenase-4 component F